MNSKPKTLQLVFLTLATILFNLVLFYMINCTGGILRSHDIFGTEYSYTAKEIALQSEIMESLPQDNVQAQALLNRQITDINEYYHAALYTAQDYYALDYWSEAIPTKERAQIARQLYDDYTASHPGTTPEAAVTDLKAQLDAHLAVLNKFEYILGYSNYVTGVAANAKELSQLSLYNQSGWALNNIIKTQKDFYGLNQVTLNPVMDAGYMSLLNYHITDIFGLLMTLAAIWLLAPCKTLYNQRRSPLPVSIWLAGLVVMYLSNMLLTDSFIGLPDFDVAIQSLYAFKSCSYLISCGALLAICLILKLAGFTIVLCLGLLLVSAPKKPTAFLIAGITGIQLFFALYNDESRLFVLFRETNIFSAFSGERFFLRYLNLDVFGIAVPSLPVFILFLIVLTVGMIFATSLKVSAYTKELLAQAQRSYYDEIERRHDEVRKIRHDMNNHLLVLSLLMEQGDMNGAQAYLGEISEKIDQTIMPVRTGSNVLDALIWQKLRQAQDLSVEIKTEICCSLSGKTISDYDLCGIFGNILDNALVAVKGSKEPMIKLFIGKQMNMLYISCENPFEGELKRRGDKLITTKGSPEHHGLGITHVKEIAKGYDGAVNISTDNGRFLIEILLNYN